MQVNQLLDDSLIYRNEFLEAFNNFRQERKKTSKKLYAFDESYAAFLFIQTLVSCSRICEELFREELGIYDHK